MIRYLTASTKINPRYKRTTDAFIFENYHDFARCQEWSLWSSRIAATSEHKVCRTLSAWLMITPYSSFSTAIRSWRRMRVQRFMVNAFFFLIHRVLLHSETCQLWYNLILRSLPAIIMVSIRSATILLLSVQALANSWDGWEDPEYTVTATVTKTKYVCPCDKTSSGWDSWSTASESRVGKPSDSWTSSSLWTSSFSKYPTTSSKTWTYSNSSSTTTSSTVSRACVRVFVFWPEAIVHV